MVPGRLAGRLPPQDVEAFILAGGASRRMGGDKARLRERGAALAVVLARRIAPHVARVRLVAKRGSGLEDLGLELLYDDREERALVHGVGAALATEGAEWRLLLACDMPGVDGAVLEALWCGARDAGVPGCVPRLPGRAGIEPLPSLWHRDIAARIEPSWGMAARDWVRAAGLATWAVPAAAIPRLANLNTPEEWEAWLRDPDPSAARPVEPAN